MRRGRKSYDICAAGSGIGEQTCVVRLECEL